MVYLYIQSSVQYIVPFNAKIVRDWPDDVIRLVPKTLAVPKQPCNFAPMSFLSAYYPPNPLASFSLTCGMSRIPCKHRWRLVPNDLTDSNLQATGEANLDDI